MQVKNAVGIDLGKKTMELIRLTDSGSMKRTHLKTDEKGFRKLSNWLNKDDTVVLETGNLSFRIAKYIMKEVGIDVVVLNAGDLATIYRSLKKTDKEDALKLARLLMRHPREELPEVRIPDEKEEHKRRLSSEQEFWSSQRTKFVNRLHSLFHASGLTLVTKKQMSDRETRRGYIMQVDDLLKREANRLDEEIERVEKYLEDIQKEIQKCLREDKETTRIMMSIPGIGPVTSLAISGYIGTGERFSHSKQVAYYVGLVPRVDISGDRQIYGKTIKRGCRQVKRAIIQAAWALVRSHEGGELRRKYEDLKAQKGSKKAIIAVARKMIELVYTLLTRREIYKHIPPDKLSKKLAFYGVA